MTPIVRIQNLSKTFGQARGFFGSRGMVAAVSGVSLDIAGGETLGVVGESGCGKSTLGRMAVGLLEPTGGDVLINGQSLFNKEVHKDYAAFRRSLAGVVQMIFQDPYSSLNPRMRIGESVAEPLRCSRSWLKEEQLTETLIRERVADMLRRVGLDADAGGRYPHEFSGGQRQRIAIARALATRPAFVVCDEPTSSLDASVQSQVLNLLRDMQEDLGLTYCFISHDLAVVRHMSDRVAVMYRGFLVEEGEAESLFAAPCHPYTRLLLDSVPETEFGEPSLPPGASNDVVLAPQENICEKEGKGRAAGNFSGKAAGIGGTPGSLSEGCAFAPRCPKVMDVCRAGVPPIAPVDGNRRVRCLFPST